MISFRDSNKKQTYGTRNNKKHLMIRVFFLKWFINFEHQHIWPNFEEKYMDSFRDSNKKRINGTRNNKKRLMICPFLLKYFNNFEHPDIWLNLQENCLNSSSDSNRKRIYEKRNNKKSLMICPVCCNISTILSSKCQHDISTSCFPYTFREK